jgi:hypothetical protein
MELTAAVKAYFAEGEQSEIEEVELLETHSETEVNVRIRWPNEVSDWKLNLDEDGTVLDAYNYNTVAEY